MAEPAETVRVVLGSSHLEDAELLAASGVLDAHRFDGDVGVLKARRKVKDEMKRRGLEAGSPTAQTVAPAIRPSRAPVALEDAIYSGQTRPPRANRRGGGVGVVLGVVGLLAVLGVVLTRQGDQEPVTPRAAATASAAAQSSSVVETEDEAQPEGRGAAWTACKDQIELELLAPATAEYPSVTSAEFRFDGAAWNVESYVDAENEFGALVRTSWNCVVTVDQAGVATTVAVNFT